MESSKYLIVICSPYSAKSEWVNNEVKTFIESGRLEYIIPFFVDGNSTHGDDSESLPLSLVEYVTDHPASELLGIHISEVGPEKAFVRVVSRMLGVNFDELWKRHERQRRRRIMSWSIGTPIVAGLLYYFIIPVSLRIQVVDERHHLPMPSNAVLLIANAKYPLDHLDSTIIINDIPGYYRGRTFPVSFSSDYYLPIAKASHLGLGEKNTLILNLKRDSSFAIYAGTVVDVDGRPIEQARVQIGDTVAFTDSNGYFKLEFSVDEQSEYKTISIIKAGKEDFLRDDECPSDGLKYIIHDE